MTIIEEVKARITKIIIPDALLIIVSMISILGVFINICTTLFFGFGDEYTSLKQLIIFAVLAIISLKLGFGKKVTSSIKFNTIDKNDITENIFTISIKDKKETKEYNISSRDIKCIYEDKSKDITLLFKDNRSKFKLVISDNKADSIEKLFYTLKDCGVTTRIVKN